MSKPTVFISGANGFIAQHIVKQLLDSKAYKVVGSVRSTAKADKLKSDFGNNPDLSLVIVEDLSKLDAFDSVFKEHGASFDYIFHTASPHNFSFEDFENSVIVPAVNGTKNIFEATVKYAPNVKKFVQTSSAAAMINLGPGEEAKKPVTEESWNLLTLDQAMHSALTSYMYSKTTAEKTLWNLHQKLSPNFTLTVLSPAYTFGPQCFDSAASDGVNVSNRPINDVVHSTPQDFTLENTTGNFVDVRDVAKAHLEAITNDKLNGHRLLLGEAEFTSQDIADIINTNFPELQGKIIKDVHISGESGPDFSFKMDNHVTKELLGFKLIDLSTSVTDTVEQLLRVSKK
ncbi:hypothetical protein ACO0QE_000119 [Hanseniaspora vineae]